MSARDELTATLVNLPWRSKSADVVADAILAAGYRKPRTITSAEELDALPGGSIIHDADGLAWQKYNRPISDKPAWFSANRSEGFYFSSNFIDDGRAPVTVLYEPEPQP